MKYSIGHVKPRWPAGNAGSVEANEAGGYGTPDGEEMELRPSNGTDSVSPYRLVNGNLNASTPSELSKTRHSCSGLIRRLATMSINPPWELAILSISSAVPGRTSVGVSAIRSSLIAFSPEAMSAAASLGTVIEIDPLSSEVATATPNSIGA